MYLYSVTWTDPSCTYTVTPYISGIDKNTIASRIITGPKWYFGGKNLWNFDTVFSYSTSSYSIGYVYSSDSTESYISLSTYTTTSGSPSSDSTTFTSNSVSTSSKSTGVFTATPQPESNVGSVTNSGKCRITN